jgi:hypothetical protein
VPSAYTDATTQANDTACLDVTDCTPITELNSDYLVFPQIAPAECPAFAQIGYAAAAKAGVDPDLMMAFAANETGYTNTDSGQDVYQGFVQTNPAVYNSAGLCIDKCGEGPWQVDIGGNPGYTGGLNVTANAAYAAMLIANAISAATAYLGPGATTAQIYDAAGNYYNGYTAAMHNPTVSTHQQWEDASETYGDSLMRHYQRLKDFRPAASCTFN